MSLSITPERSYTVESRRHFNGANSHVYRNETLHGDQQDRRDDVNLEALITDLQSSFPSEQQPLLQSETSSLVSDLAYTEIEPYEYTIHDLRPQNTEAQKRSMPLPVGPTSSLLPNPFPELEKSPQHTEVTQGSRTAPASPATQSTRWGSHPSFRPTEWKSGDSQRRVCVNFYSDESSHKTLVIHEGLTASDVAALLILKFGAVHDKNWVIVEHLHSIDADRSLEDHEKVFDTFLKWGTKSENKFVFRQDFKKYDLFQNPTLYFPTQLTDVKEEQGVLSDKVERHRQVLLQNLMSSTDRLPDLQGYLHLKEAGKKSWKKAFFVLRGSGLYYSSKGTSKDPKHLVTFCQFLDINVYVANSSKKCFHSPSQFVLCFKPDNTASLEPKEMKCLCAEDEKTRMCWLAGIRLAKYGKQLQENYRSSLRRQEKLNNLSNGSSPPNSDGADPKERVAMDFTGVNGGRVVDDPNEAIGVAIEEGLQWRKKITRPTCLPTTPGSSKNTSGSMSPALGRGLVVSNSLNMMQPWFHHGVSRDEANELLAKHGMVDGLFLVRESRMMNGCYVLSLVHSLRVKHFQIALVVENGKTYYSLDGNTKFADLIQLVDFYQLNAGGLPVKLEHYVTKLA